MKTNISLRVLAISLMASFAIAFTTPALANDEKKAIPVELKFVGNLKNQPLFHLVFNGVEETVYTIVIRDESGGVFYRENVKGTAFMKKFLLNIEEIDDAKLKFEITSKGYDKPVVFEVNNQSRLVEEMVVNKIR
jgi:hypothetical protein